MFDDDMFKDMVKIFAIALLPMVFIAAMLGLVKLIELMAG